MRRLTPAVVSSRLSMPVWNFDHHFDTMRHLSGVDQHLGRVCPISCRIRGADRTLIIDRTGAADPRSGLQLQRLDRKAPDPDQLRPQDVALGGIGTLE
jgi:hypothetical protein